MRFITLLSFISLLFVIACDDPQADLQTNIETASEYVLSEVSYFDVFNYVDKAARDSVLQAQGYTQIDSANVSLSLVNAGLQLDFGNGVACPDGHFRSGIILANMSGDYAADTVSVVISFQNYIVDGRALAGNILLHKDFTTLDKDLTLEVTNGSLTDSLGNVSSFTAYHTLRWLDGLLTYGDVSDDIYSVLSGSTADGTAHNGQGFNAEVTSDLVYEHSCKWIGLGVLDLTLPGAIVSSGSIDFGSGDCDDKVVFLFGGSSIPYYMD